MTILQLTMCNLQTYRPDRFQCDYRPQNSSLEIFIVNHNTATKALGVILYSPLVTTASCQCQPLSLCCRHHIGWLSLFVSRTTETDVPALQDLLQTASLCSLFPRAASPHLSTCHTVCGLCSESSSIAHYF